MVDPISISIASTALALSITWVIRKMIKRVRRSSCSVVTPNVTMEMKYSNRSVPTA